MAIDQLAVATQGLLTSGGTSFISEADVLLSADPVAVLTVGPKATISIQMDEVQLGVGATVVLDDPGEQVTLTDDPEVKQ